MFFTAEAGNAANQLMQGLAKPRTQNSLSASFLLQHHRELVASHTVSIHIHTTTSPCLKHEQQKEKNPEASLG